MPVRSFCLGMSLLLAAGGCLVKERCYNDADCVPPEVCSAGTCRFECHLDSDCDEDFGVEYVCREHHCRFPAECAACGFPHASSSCVHGVCSMGECDADHHDLDGKAENGCEYACLVSHGGVELCDEKDNDCDGKIDEGFDLGSDTDNCGRCGNRCPTPPNADARCVFGRCVYICRTGWYDSNGDPQDGCESTLCVPGEEICDGQDNNCNCPGDTNADGIVCGPNDEGVDEGFDKTSPETCGDWCARCEYANAAARCVGGQCALGECHPDWYDANENPADGCECRQTNGGLEICDSVDNDCDGEIDEGGVCGLSCPEDMVLVEDAFCLDRYEASRPDATSDGHGQDESRAVSRPGVLPWMVNPMNGAALVKFQAACAAAGKHLCTKQEWHQACTGPAPGTLYPYGNTFDREICNCVDTFCDDWCAEQGIAPGDCNTSPNCGYTYYCFHVMPTGAFPDCLNAYGAYDVAGNVWEIVPSNEDARGYEVRGGAFNCASPAARLQCTFNAGWDQLYAGFRCCREPIR